MKIGSVCLHSCIRAHKMNWVLLARGHEVHWISEQVFDAHGWKDYTATHLIHTGNLDFKTKGIDKTQLASTIRALSPIIDVFHVHNEPDWIVSVVKENTDKPVVWDIHDMLSQRLGEREKFEDEALECADGVSVVSRLYRDIIVKRSPGKPVIEMLSCVPEGMMPEQRRVPQRMGLVYEGGLKGKPRNDSVQFTWRDWKHVFTRISTMNIETWAYPSDPREDFSEYGGLITIGPLPFIELIKNLTAHEVGLVGSPWPDPAFDGALPNKMFEYIAAGIPAIAYNAPTAREFLETTGLGVGIDSLEELPDAMNQLWDGKVREEVWVNRKYWTMERQIHKIEEMYCQVTGANVHKMRQSLCA